MPKFTASRTAARPGLYRWVGEQLDRRYATPDARVRFAEDELNICLPDVEDPPEQVRRYREGLSVAVPAWMLDGHNAHAAGFWGVVPKDRALRAQVYVVDPDDRVRGSGELDTSR